MRSGVRILRHISLFFHQFCINGDTFYLARIPLGHTLSGGGQEGGVGVEMKHIDYVEVALFTIAFAVLAGAIAFTFL